MNGSVYVLMFVFCVCLTAVILSGLFANMLIHECLQGHNPERQDAIGASWDRYMVHKIN